MSAISQLQCVLSPPSRPKFVLDAESMGEFRRVVGYPLPDDYVEFVRVYGVGYIRTEHHELDFVRIYTPRMMLSENRVFYDALDSMTSEAREMFRFSGWKEPNGHLLWGSSCDGHNYAWVMHGASSVWEIAVHDRYSDAIDCFDLRFAEFLLAAIQGRIQPSGIPEVIRDGTEKKVWVDQNPDVETPA